MPLKNSLWETNSPFSIVNGTVNEISIPRNERSGVMERQVGEENRTLQLDKIKEQISRLSNMDMKIVQDCVSHVDALSGDNVGLSMDAPNNFPLRSGKIVYRAVENSSYTWMPPHGSLGRMGTPDLPVFYLAFNEDTAKYEYGKKHGFLNKYEFIKPVNAYISWESGISLMSGVCKTDRKIAHQIAGFYNSIFALVSNNKDEQDNIYKITNWLKNQNFRINDGNEHVLLYPSTKMTDKDDLFLSNDEINEKADLVFCTSESYVKDTLKFVGQIKF